MMNVLSVMFVLLSITMLYEFISQLDNITGNYNALDAFLFALLRLPQLVFEMLPISMLIGSLLCLGNHANNSELVIMHSAGISIRDLAKILSMGGLVGIVISILVGEFMGPPLDYYARNISLKDDGYKFDIITPSNEFTNVEFNQIGGHNLLNALGAFSVAHYLGLDENKLINALADFKGVNRRMDVFRLGNKIVVDDYAHHPSEINAVLNSIKDKYNNLKVGVIFQPHLFSRTKDLLEDFAKVLSKFDEVYLLDIYPAREEPIEGVSSDALLEKIICNKKGIIKIESIIEKIESIESDIVAVLGAGNVANSIQSLKKKYYESSI